MREGKIKQSIHKIYALEEGAQAIQDLMDRKVKGKAIVKVGNWVEEPVIAAVKKQAADDAVKETKLSGPLEIENLADIKKHIGKAIGTSDWLTVTQQMINDFAAATLDFQWVHIDVEKAKTLMPEGKTIAHGYLSMSLASHFLYQMIKIKNVNSFINYGINKARFITPVKEGSRIRLHASVQHVEEQGNGAVKLFLNIQMEIEGLDKPAYAAEIISLIM